MPGEHGAASLVCAPASCENQALLERSYSAIVGLETQISAFQKRSHWRSKVRRGKDRFHKENSQLQIMMDALAQAHRETASLEVICLKKLEITPTTRQKSPNARVWITEQKSMALREKCSLQSDELRGQGVAPSDVDHKEASLAHASASPPSSPLISQGSSGRSPVERLLDAFDHCCEHEASCAETRGAALPQRLLCEVETQTADEQAHAEKLDKDQTFIKAIARHDALNEEESLLKESLLREFNIAGKAKQTALENTGDIQERQSEPAADHANSLLQQLRKAGQAKSDVEVELIAKQQQLIQALMVEQEQITSATLLNKQIQEMEELVWSVAKPQEAASDKASPQDDSSSTSMSPPMLVSPKASPRARPGSRLRHSRRSSSRANDASWQAESPTGSSGASIAYSKRPGGIASKSQASSPHDHDASATGMCCNLTEAQQLRNVLDTALAKQIQDEGYLKSLEEENSLLVQALEEESRRRSMLESCLQSTSRSLQGKCDSDAREWEGEKLKMMLNHKDRESELEAEVQQQKSRLEQDALQGERARLNHKERESELEAKVQQQKSRLEEKELQWERERLEMVLNHKERESELEAEVQQQKSRLEELRKQTEILERALDAALDRNTNDEVSIRLLADEKAQLQAALQKEEVTVRALVEVNDALQAVQAGRDGEICWQDEAGGAHEVTASGPQHEVEAATKAGEDETCNTNSVFPPDEAVVSREVVEVESIGRLSQWGEDQGSGLTNRLQPAGHCDSYPVVEEPAAGKLVAEAVSHTVVQFNSRGEETRQQPPTRLPPMSPRQLKTFHLPTRTRRRDGKALQAEPYSSQSLPGLADRGRDVPRAGVESMRETTDSRGFQHGYGPTEDLERAPQCGPAKCRVM